MPSYIYKVCKFNCILPGLPGQHQRCCCGVQHIEIQTHKKTNDNKIIDIKEIKNTLDLKGEYHDFTHKYLSCDIISVCQWAPSITKVMQWSMARFNLIYGIKSILEAACSVKCILDLSLCDSTSDLEITYSD